MQREGFVAQRPDGVSSLLALLAGKNADIEPVVRQGWI